MYARALQVAGGWPQLRRILTDASSWMLNPKLCPCTPTQAREALTVAAIGVWTSNSRHESPKDALRLFDSQHDQGTADAVPLLVEAMPCACQDKNVGSDNLLCFAQATEVVCALQYKVRLEAGSAPCILLIVGDFMWWFPCSLTGFKLSLELKLEVLCLILSP